MRKSGVPAGLFSLRLPVVAAAVCLLALLSSLPSAAQTVGVESKIERTLLDQLDDRDKVTFWVRMSAAANVASASGIKNWTERGEFVLEDSSRVPSSPRRASSIFWRAKAQTTSPSGS